ncbi:MAG: TM2 domain-containing protein [Enterococcus sp.]|nr:TM2 domain-containing protein [Enterococcus sp.]
MSTNDNENTIPQHPVTEEPYAVPLQDSTSQENLPIPDPLDNTGNTESAEKVTQTTPPPPPEAPSIGSQVPYETPTVSLDKEPSDTGYAPPPPPHGAWHQGSQYYQGQSPPPPYMAYPQYMPPQMPPKPKTMETAFAYLFFLGLFGGHKFYMGQNALGNIYLIVGLVFFVFLGLPIIGTFFGFFVFLGLMANLYADIRTMREQLDRSERGEKFTVNTQAEFFTKAFSNK